MQVGLAPGSLPGYRFLRPIGMDPVGVWYEAEQESLARRVAVNVLRPELRADDAARGMVIEEYLSVSQVLSIPLFFAIGLVFVLCRASPIATIVFCWTFTIARILHTIAYTRKLQPWRAIFYGIGTLALLGMIVHIILMVI